MSEPDRIWLWDSHEGMTYGTYGLTPSEWARHEYVRADMQAAPLSSQQMIGLLLARQELRAVILGVIQRGKASAGVSCGDPICQPCEDQADEIMRLIDATPKVTP